MSGLDLPSQISVAESCADDGEMLGIGIGGLSICRRGSDNCQSVFNTQIQTAIVIRLSSTLRLRAGSVT